MANTKVTGDLIASSTIATGNIADNAVTSDKISGITTAHITEGTNLYYTDARADARAALLVDSAPSTLNTLNELAAALGDDPNFATTVTNSIGTKMPLVGGTFTGTVEISATIPRLNFTDLQQDDWAIINDNGEFKFQCTSGSGVALQLAANNNATFAGDVNVQNASTRIISLNYEDGVNSIISHSGTNFGLESLNVRGDAIRFYTDYDASSPKGNLTLTLDTSHNATFAGTITSGTLSVGTSGTSRFTDTNAYPLQLNRGLAVDVVGAAGTIFGLGAYSTGTTYIDAVRIIGILEANGTDGDMQLQVLNSGTHTTALTLNNDTNATFAGEITSGDDINAGGKLVCANVASDKKIAFRRTGANNFSIEHDSSSLYFYNESTSELPIRFFNNGNVSMIAGNVGIGTTSPDYILTTQGSGVQRLKVVATDPSQHSAGVYFLVKNGASQVGTGTIATQNNGDMDFYTGSTSEAFRMTILAGGNVGIGTTSPSYKLEVNGTTKATSSYHQNVNFTNTPTFQIGTDAFSSGFFVYDSTTAAYRMVVKSSTGNVGIGTTSPSKKLSVADGMVVGNNNTDAGATQIYGDIRRPQSHYYCERIWKRNSGATPQTYSIARQWHDHANWSGGHINVIIWGTGPTVGQLYKADFSCGYGYSGGSVHVSVNFNPGGLAVPVWGSAVQANGNIHYRDLTITPPGYNTYVVQVINPGGIIQTYDINNTGQAIYFYPQ